MNKKQPSVVLRRPLTTWLTNEDFEKIKALAKSHGVSTAAYMRSIVVDVLAEETESFRISSAAACQRGII